MRSSEDTGEKIAVSPSVREGELSLVTRSLSGDGAATDALVQRLSCVPRILMSLNRRMGGPLSEADLADCSQDTLVVIWGKRETFKGFARIETWAYRFCFLEFMNRFRAKGRSSQRNGARLDMVVESVAAPSRTSHLDYEQLERELSELGPPEEVVIRLKHYELRTFKDIGEVLDISPNTAKTHYYRGLAWLRRRLGPGEGTL